MLYFFRNISIRLCIAVALSIPAAFLLLPTVHSVLPSLGDAIFCITLICSLFIIAGYIMNTAGERSIQRCINEAKTWERDGVFHKSEACYLKALEIFDSYLLTILTSKKIALQLTGAIARFSLTSGWHNSHFDRAAMFFLLKNPHETEVAYLWLKKVLKTKFSNERKSRNHLFNVKSQFLSSADGFGRSAKKNLLTQQEQNLITLLAEMEPLDPKFVPLLAEIFTQTAQADFAAKRIFAIMQRNFNNECLDKSYKQQDIRDVEDLSAKEDSSNLSIELPEQKPISALKYSDDMISKPERAISSEHSISKSIPKIEDEQQIGHLSDEASFMYQYQANRPFSSGRIRRNIKGVKKPSSIFSLFGRLTSLYNADSTMPSILSAAGKFGLVIASLPMNIVSILIDIVKYIGKVIVSSFKNISRAVSVRPELGKNIKRLMLLAVTTGVILLLANTVLHLFQTPAPPPPPSTAKVETEDAEVQVVPQKRFTIQVAAYLSKSHAEQYLSNLAKKGVKEGAIAAVEGGGKTWYLIRVGRYETKESATEYGNQLKSQGVVNDFFVDNSSR